eukprot:CAMPEP_0182558332 /NCGR_PEP_ID=MMETSP1324-20130603/1910_1 /TAXON_ID=236786 /ORGANISM="Florenciella sp., Strain RCC1587" /LENGTH=88 /DNA_ID=CAMNT_0024770499 /DNA_START=93 /DNA_END=359 /DNA_ORIENTATION=-
MAGMRMSDISLAQAWPRAATLVATRPPLGLRVVKVPIGGLRAPRPDSLNVIRITLGWHLDRRRAEHAEYRENDLRHLHRRAPLVIKYR